MAKRATAVEEAVEEAAVDAATAAEEAEAEEEEACGTELWWVTGQWEELR